MLDAEGFIGTYNFVYMPTNLGTQEAFGYAFVNLNTPEEARRCFSHFQGYQKFSVASDKPCAVSWSNSNQGLQANIRRYQNSPVMHGSVPEWCKPALYEKGVRVHFPAPTRPVKAPKTKNGLKRRDREERKAKAEAEEPPDDPDDEDYDY